MTVPLGRTVSAVAALVGRAGMTGRTGARLTAGQAIARPARAAVVTAGPAGHAGLTRTARDRAGGPDRRGYDDGGGRGRWGSRDDGGSRPGAARRGGPRSGDSRPSRPGGGSRSGGSRSGGYGPGAGGRPGGPGGGRPGRETAGTGGPRSGGPAGEAGSLPYVPASITADQLDPEARAELRTLPGDLAEAVARQLIAASLAEDPEQAYRHAQAARQLAARVGVVRESVGIAAYRAGHWAEALAELRAARRLTGRSTYLPMMADSERALGRLDRALDLVTGPRAEEADRATRIELKIVESGIRRDQGLPGAAVVALQIPELTDGRQRRGSARLYYAYADALLDAGRDDEAREWFARAAGADTQGETDADERFDELDQLAIEDLQAGDEEATTRATRTPASRTTPTTSTMILTPTTSMPTTSMPTTSTTRRTAGTTAPATRTAKPGPVPRTAPGTSPARSRSTTCRPATPARTTGITKRPGIPARTAPPRDDAADGDDGGQLNGSAS